MSRLLTDHMKLLGCDSPIKISETAFISLVTLTSKNVHQKIDEILSSENEELISRLTSFLLHAEKIIDVCGVEATPSSHLDIKVIGEEGEKYIDYIKTILYTNTLNEKNPIAIYKGDRLIFCNLAWENVTGYTFKEIEAMDILGIDIMEKFYSYSPTELARVQMRLGNALETGEGYDEQIFALQRKDGEIVRIAWHTEPLSGEYTIRKGNVNLASNMQSMMASRAIVEDLIKKLMLSKDGYTGGHISRVMYLSVVLGEIFGYDSKKRELLKLIAGLHDLGKNDVDNAILRKPGPLTLAERKSINSHAGNGIFEGIKMGYDDFILGMPHHSFFYAPWGDLKLNFDTLVNQIRVKIQKARDDIEQGKTNFSLEELIEEIKNEEDTLPTLFNHLVGKNIPEEARIVSIADAIDAMVSRRSYHPTRLTPLIEDLINEVEEELLESTGFKVQNNIIVLDERKWRHAEKSEQKFPNCIDWNGVFYIPCYENTNVKIQFDPIILAKMYIDGKLSEKIKISLRNNDAELLPDKIIELEQYLLDFDKKLSYDSSSWTEEDTTSVGRFKEAIIKLGEQISKKL